MLRISANVERLEDFLKVAARAIRRRAFRVVENFVMPRMSNSCGPGLCIYRTCLADTLARVETSKRRSGGPKRLGMPWAAL